MIEFVTELKSRNEAMFWFGSVSLVTGLVFLLLSRFSDITLDGVNVWYKPFKFAASIGIYCWTMGWCCSYLTRFNHTLFNYTIIILLGLELLYIALQAGGGQRSHFNISSPIYSALYGFMAIAASAVALYTAYVGTQFFGSNVVHLPQHYLTAIRWGIVLFVIFSFQGFAMGSRLQHTVGGADGNHGIPILNWSTKFGDLRIAHFLGMHALQIMPLIACYLLKNNTSIHVLGIAYLLLATATLVQALQGKPLFS